jgi:hypothetical protein
MTGSHKSGWPSLVIAVAIFLLGWFAPFAHAQPAEPEAWAARAKGPGSTPPDADAQPTPKEPQVAHEAGAQAKPKETQVAQDSGPQARPKQTQVAQESGEQAKPKEPPAKGAATEGGSGSGQKFDPAVVSAGQAAFERSCTKCHDAARALERTKDLAGWRATVRRMANRRGADIATADIEPIAVYLASRNAPAAATGGTEAAATPAEKDKAGGGAAAATSPPTPEPSGISAYASISPQWRGGNNHIQNPDFGPLAWVGASWQGKIVSGRVTVCITCHGVQEPGLISRIDPVEVAVRIDLSSFLEPHCHGMKGSLDAGRFIVPFGAFSAQTDPSLYRTVSTPLIFNMGQRVFNVDLGFPVLPMPYVDEGVNLNLSVPICECHHTPVTATLDGYVLNGLEGSASGLDFLQSRDLFDNNVRVAGGTRLTVGLPNVRAGASFMAGRFDDPNTSGVPSGLYYTIYGFDFQAKYKRLFRFQVEYARRDSERLGMLAGSTAVLSEGVYGYYVEAEARHCDKSKVSLLARYDWQGRSSTSPPNGSTLPFGDFHVERLTVGVNIELWQQSLLMVDFERWLVPEPGHRTVDVFGIRYTITF